MLIGINNKKSIFNSIIGSILLLLVIGTTTYVIISNNENFNIFNKKLNDSINYTLSNSLEISEFNLEERKDALKIFLPTELLSNPNTEYIDNLFKEYQIDCTGEYDPKNDFCYKIDDTLISCNKEKCEVNNFNLDDDIDEFINKFTSENLEKLEIKDCSIYDGLEKIGCDQNNAYLLTYNVEEKIYESDKQEVIENYKEMYSLPTRYITYSTLPYNEINNLQSVFNEEVIWWKSLQTFGYITLTIFDFTDLGGNTIKFISKNFDSKIILNVIKKLGTVSFIDMNNAGKIKRFMTSIIPDLFKYDSAITSSTSKISLQFLDETTTNFFKNSKKLAKNNNFDEFSNLLKKSNPDLSNIEDKKLYNYYNELKKNIDPSIDNLDYQLSIELTQSNQKTTSIAKSIISNSILNLMEKNTDLTSDILLDYITNSLKKYIKSTKLRKFMMENIDNFNDILEKIVKNNIDKLTTKEISIIEESFKQINENFGKEILTSNIGKKTTIELLKDSKNIQNIFIDNYNILNGKKIIDNEYISFNNPIYEKIFAQSSETLSEILNDNILDNDILELLFEQSFIKISKETISDTSVNKVITKVIDNIDLDIYKNTDKLIKIVSDDKVLRATLDEDIIISFGTLNYKINVETFNNLRLSNNNDIHSIYTALKNQKDIVSPNFEELNTLKSISMNSKTTIDTVTGLDPNKEIEFLSELNNDFPLINNNNIDDIFEELNDIKTGKKNIENILEIDELSVLKNEEIITDILNDMNFDDKLIEYINLEKDFNSQYEKIFNSIYNKKENEIIIDLQAATKNTKTNTIYESYNEAFIDSQSFNNNFFDKFNSETFEALKNYNIKTSIINKISKSIYETTALTVCYDLFLDTFKEKKYDLDEIEIYNNIDSETFEKYKDNFNELNENQKNIFLKSNNINDLSDIAKLGFVNYCITSSSIPMKNGLFRILFNYLEEENAYYLPNEINSIDTISLYNRNNYYSFDQMEYFSPLKLSSFENYILRLKKSDNWYEPFYLISPCNTSLLFEKNNDVQCKYDVYDYIYNSYTLNGNTDNLECNKINFVLDENKESNYKLINNLLINENDYIKEKYKNLFNSLIEINEIDNDIISNFIYILFDKNMEYTSYYFFKNYIKNNNENINLYNTYLNLVNDTIVNIIDYNQINYNQINNNIFYLNNNTYNTNFNIKINYNTNKNFSYFFNYYNQYNIPGFIFNTYLQSDIREYNNINYFKKIENYTPIILKIDKDKFKDNIANINISNLFIKEFLLSENEFNEFYQDFYDNNYKNNNYNDYYIFDIIYNENINFKYNDYKNYFNILNFDFFYSNNEKASTALIDLYDLDYTTLLETNLFFEGFENFIFNFTQNSYNELDLSKLIKIIYDNNLYDLLNDYIIENTPYYYDCSNLNYNILESNKIIKECKTEGTNFITNKAKTIDVSLMNTNKDSYCYYYISDISSFYQKNNDKLGFFMTIPGIVGGFLGPTPVGIALQLIDVSYSLYDLSMSKKIESDNKWPNSPVSNN